MAKKKRRNPDHVRRRNVPGPDNEVIEGQLTELLTPAINAQRDYYRQLGLRSRILTLPLMVAAVSPPDSFLKTVFVNIMQVNLP